MVSVGKAKDSQGICTAALAMPSLQRGTSVCRYSDYRVMYNVSEDVKGRNVTESLASSLEGESTLAERQLV